MFWKAREARKTMVAVLEMISPNSGMQRTELRAAADAERRMGERSIGERRGIKRLAE
jgi:hypothetical protein